LKKPSTGSTEIKVEIKSGVKLRTFEELVPEVEPHICNHLEKLHKGLKVRGR
jgi:hypothetical protein